MAQAENKDLPEEEKSSSEETVLMNKKVGFGHNNSRECVEVLRDGLSAKVTILEIQLELTNIAETSNKESQNILSESCYLHIKCTAANSLAALMWR